MDGILIYARIGNQKIFLDTTDSIDDIKASTMELLYAESRPSWKPHVFFQLNGQEFKLFTEDDE